MLIYSPLSAYFDDVIPQQPALSNDGKQRQPALGDFTSPIGLSSWTITLVGVPPSDIRVLPEQQARDKSKAKRKNL
jgi:hypothetical protein